MLTGHNINYDSFYYEFWFMEGLYLKLLSPEKQFDKLWRYHNVHYVS